MTNEEKLSLIGEAQSYLELNDNWGDEEGPIARKLEMLKDDYRGTGNINVVDMQEHLERVISTLKTEVFTADIEADSHRSVALGSALRNAEAAMRLTKERI